MFDSKSCCYFTKCVLFDVLFQVLSPLSDSILAEKTVTVLDDKVKKKSKKCFLACIIISYSYVVSG